ncbi:enoyl-ACP reductase FabI [Alcaligenaceae bacterium SJ-26]|nr:enoyl-ACP reductase FabI [Alcaligenaceae bacterium SJ-26]
MQSPFSLAGKKGLIVGIANDKSIAWGCAKAIRQAGAELAVTWQTEKSLPHVQPLFDTLQAPIQMQLDVTQPAQMEAVFERIRSEWGRLDFVIHSIAFAPKQDLHGRVIDSSVEGFLQAMDISCHSFVRMARLAEPLMTEGGSLLAMSYLGAQEVVPHYGIMGPVKAALESSVRYLASELGGAGIRVHAVSPGPIKTRAASGIADFDHLIAENAQRAPLGDILDIDDVGALSAFLVSDGARAMTGSTVYVDGGFNILN